MAYAKIVLDATQKAELEEMADSERDQDLALRARIVLMLAEGMRVVDIAKKLGVNKDAVTRWKRRWLEGGADALRSRHGGGRAPVGDTNGLASRIRGLIDSNPSARRPGRYPPTPASRRGAPASRASSCRRGGAASWRSPRAARSSPSAARC